MVLYLQCRGLDQILQRYKLCKTFQPLKTPNSSSPFLGLINYLHPFLPNLAAKTTFLWEKVTNWDWNPSTNQAFNSLKSWISYMLLKTTLTYYDCTKPLTLQTNASEYGLSTALIQNNRPIAFASKTLTDVETRYANIEWECLSVVFGLEKFHTCIWQTYHSTKWSQASGDDPEETHTTSTAKTTMHAP